MVTMDPPHHTRTRGLLNRLLTPKRLKENEEFMWDQADRRLDEFGTAPRSAASDRVNPSVRSRRNSSRRGFTRRASLVKIPAW
jgi:cytochrome P450